LNKDIELLLVLFEHFNKVVGRTRLQKIVFLLQNKFNIKFSYKFISYYYGPYSKDLQFEVNLLNAMGMINVSAGDGVYIHTLSEKGVTTTKEIIEQRKDDPEIKELISRLDYFRDKDTSSLIIEAKNLIKNPETLFK